MAYLIPANMVYDALAATYTHGVDAKMTLDSSANFPAAPGGVVFLDDGVEWVVRKYTAVVGDDLDPLAVALAVNASAGAGGHVFQIGTVVKLTQAADYLQPIANDIVSAPAGAIFYEDTDEIGSSANLTYDGTTFECDDAAIFNESGADVDFRIEGVGEVNAFFVQGSDGFVGLGRVPSYRLDVAGYIRGEIIYIVSVAPQLRLIDTDDPGDPNDYLRMNYSAGVMKIEWRDAAPGVWYTYFTMSTTEVVVNDAGLDIDFRVAGDGSANALFVQASGDNVGVGTVTFQAAAVGCFAIGNGTEPGAHTDNQIYLYSKDSVGGGDGATLGIYCEHAVDAGAWVADAAFHIWFNGVEYRLGLDTV